MSQKEFVIERMAKLESREIQPVRRGPGRPRGENYGKRWQSKADPNNPLSLARSEAGKKGRAVTQTRHMLEAERKKYGRIFQEQFDKELEQVETEIVNSVNAKQYDHQFGRQRAKQDADELVWNCRILIEGLAWNRSYFPPLPYESYLDEFDALAAEVSYHVKLIKPESYRSFSAWPEICADDIIGLAKHRVNLAQLPLLKQFAIRGLEAFLEFAAKQKDERVLAEIATTVPKVEQAIPNVVDGSIYNPPPPPEPPEPIKSIEEQLREYHERYATYPKGESQPLKTLERKEERLQRQAEEEILRQKQLEDQRQMDLDRLHHLQSLPPDAFEYLQSGSVFGTTAQRR